MSSRSDRRAPAAASCIDRSLQHWRRFAAPEPAGHPVPPAPAPPAHRSLVPAVPGHARIVPVKIVPHIIKRPAASARHDEGQLQGALELLGAKAKRRGLALLAQVSSVAFCVHAWNGRNGWQKCCYLGQALKRCGTLRNDSIMLDESSPGKQTAEIREAISDPYTS